MLENDKIDNYCIYIYSDTMVSKPTPDICFNDVT